MWVSPAPSWGSYSDPALCKQGFNFGCWLYVVNKLLKLIRNDYNYREKIKIKHLEFTHILSKIKFKEEIIIMIVLVFLWNI